MDTITHAMLREIITRHGEIILEDPKRFEAILFDRCPGQRRDISLTVAVLREGIVDDIKAHSPSTMTAADIQRLGQRYFHQTGFDASMLTEIIATWAEALGRKVARPEPQPATAPEAGPPHAETPPQPAPVQPAAPAGGGVQASRAAAAQPPAPPQRTFLQRYGVWVGLAVGAVVTVMLLNGLGKSSDKAEEPTAAAPLVEGKVEHVSAVQETPEPVEQPEPNLPEVRYRFELEGGDDIAYSVKLYAYNENHRVEEEPGSGSADPGDDIYSGDYILEIAGADGSKDSMALPNMMFNAARGMARPVPGYPDLLEIRQYATSSNDYMMLYQVGAGKIEPVTFNESGDVYEDIIGSGLNTRPGGQFQSVLYDNAAGEWRVTNWRLDEDRHVMTATAAGSVASSESAEIERFLQEPSYFVAINGGPSSATAGMNRFILDYLDASMQAVRHYDFEYVRPYLDPNGKSYKEQKDYLGYLKSKNITEKLKTAEIISVERAGDGAYLVTTYEEYTITYNDQSSKLKGFRSQFRVVSDRSGYRLHSLVDTEELSSIDL